jgi:hypothetical protein
VIPGSGTGDTVHALLTPGEYVIRKNAVKSLGTEYLNFLNHADKYAAGGPVQPKPVVIPPWLKMPTFGQGNVTVGKDTTSVGRAGYAGVWKAAQTALPLMVDAIGNTPMAKFLIPTVQRTSDEIGRFLAQADAKSPWFLSTKAGKSITGPGTGVGAYNPSAGVKQWEALIHQALTEILGVGGDNASNLAAVELIMQNESSGNPTAINLTDSNARAGHPSQGLMQTIPSVFQKYAGPYVGRGIMDPLANIYAGINYAVHRYGSLQNTPGPRSVAHGGPYLPYAAGGLVEALVGGTGLLADGGSVGGGSNYLGTYSGASVSSSSTVNRGITIKELHVHNPRPEPASDSLSSRVRSLAYLSGSTN